MTGIQESKRYFLINENITEGMLTDIIKEIHDINEYDESCYAQIKNYEPQPIKMVVESFGGDCYSGMSLVNTMRSSITPIYTYSYGKTMSMAVPIYASGHLRFAHEDTTFMYHDMIAYSHGELEHIRDNLEENQRLLDMIDKVIYSSSSVSKEVVDAHRKLKKNWYFSGLQAFEMGLVDELLENTKYVEEDSEQPDKLKEDNSKEEATVDIEMK